MGERSPESVHIDDYKSVIDNVLSQAHNLFQDEGVDENVIEQLRHIWTSKVESSNKPKPKEAPPDALQSAQSNAAEDQQRGNCFTENALTSTFNNKLRLNPLLSCQVDGPQDSSDDDDGASSDDAVSDDNDEDKDPDDQDMDDGGPEEEPLGSGDDITDEEDPSDLFDTDNVIVCQYEKITRIRNKWKFHLKYGIMNLDGEDYVFQKADGEAEW